MCIRLGLVLWHSPLDKTGMITAQPNAAMILQTSAGLMLSSPIGAMAIRLHKKRRTWSADKIDRSVSRCEKTRSNERGSAG